MLRHLDAYKYCFSSSKFKISGKSNLLLKVMQSLLKFYTFVKLISLTVSCIFTYLRSCSEKVWLNGWSTNA